MTEKAKKMAEASASVCLILATALAVALLYLALGQDIKMVQYTDDLTVFVSNVERAQTYFPTA